MRLDDEEKTIRILDRIVLNDSNYMENCLILPLVYMNEVSGIVVFEVVMGEESESDKELVSFYSYAGTSQASSFCPHLHFF